MPKGYPWPLSPEQLRALFDVAHELGVRPENLWKLINFETAGTWDPKKKNPLSSARGLIQFLDATARDLGFPGGSAQLVEQFPTVESQLRGPVVKYLKRYVPFRDAQDLYFSVFLPRYRRAALDTVIYEGEPEKQGPFRRQNPGILTVGDYYRKLEGKLGGPVAGWGPVVLGALVIFAVLRIIR